MSKHLFLSLPLLVLLTGCSSTPPEAVTEEVAVPKAAPPKSVLYVTNERAGTLTMINAETLEPFGTLELGKRPRGIVASTDRSRLYVALSGSPIATTRSDPRRFTSSSR